MNHPETMINTLCHGINRGPQEQCQRQCLAHKSFANGRVQRRCEVAITPNSCFASRRNLPSFTVRPLGGNRGPWTLERSLSKATGHTCMYLLFRIVDSMPQLSATASTTHPNADAVMHTVFTKLEYRSDDDGRHLVSPSNESEWTHEFRPSSSGSLV